MAMRPVPPAVQIGLRSPGATRGESPGRLRPTQPGTICEPMPRAMARFLVAVCGLFGCGSHPDGTAVSLPGGNGGIGFDDLRFSSALGKVLVPAGRTGALDLVDPATLAVSRITGFGETAGYDGGHDVGPTS